MADTLTPMQTELLARTDAIFASIGNAVSKASDLAVQGGHAVAEQIPDIAYQYVAYGRAIATIELIFGLFIIAVGITVMFRYGFLNKANLRDTYGSWHGARAAAVGGGGVALFLGFVISASNTADFIMVWFAPKVWLLQEIATLVHRMH